MALSYAQVFLNKLNISSACGADLEVLGDHFGWDKLRPKLTALLKRGCRPSTLYDCLSLLLYLAPSSSTDWATGRGEVCAASIPTLVKRIKSRGLFVGGQLPSNGLVVFNARVPIAELYIQVLERFGPYAVVWLEATDVLIFEFGASNFDEAATLLFRLMWNEWGEARNKTPTNMSKERSRIYRNMALDVIRMICKEKDSGSPEGSDGEGRVESELVAGFLWLLHMIVKDSDILDKVVPHIFNNPTKYELNHTLVPALKQLRTWLGSSASRTSWFQSLLKGCVDLLDAGCKKRTVLQYKEWVRVHAELRHIWLYDSLKVGRAKY